MEQTTIWLLSAYAAVSHRSWADRIIADQPDFEWHRYELPPRHFRWRIRGNPLAWLDVLPAKPPDLILATSMVDLATLRGVRPELATTPAICYFHENQFAYPTRSGQAAPLEPQLIQLYTALSADRLLFNSAFNRDTFLAGVDALIQGRPDCRPEAIASRLRARSGVVPVPIDPLETVQERDPGLILWNHRWEYDKAPERFTEAMIALAERGHDFRLALLGPRPPTPPEPLKRLRNEVGERIVADDWVDDATYNAIVARAGIVVSTTRHEFQGLAMLEATAAGARPLVPDALCYPEQYPAAYRYPDGDVTALVEHLARWLEHGLPEPVDTRRWHREPLRGQWRQELVAASGATPQRDRSNVGLWRHSTH